MSPSDINYNYLMLYTWRTLYPIAREAVLRPFGLSAGDMTIVAGADEMTVRRWANAPTALVQPRRGLLSALRANKRPLILAYIAQGRSPLSNPLLAPMPQAANTQLLFLWHRALGDPQLAQYYELDKDDRLALAQATASMLERWSQLPVALAIPKKGLLPALRKNNPRHLLPFFHDIPT